MSYQKIGFLTAGSGGNPTGIGDYVRALDAAGKPAVIFCNNGTVGLSDIFERWDAGSTVDHVAVFRAVDPAVPNYATSAQQAAVEFRAAVLPKIPQSVSGYRDRVWILLGNELDKNRSEWLAEWSFESAELWNADGYKIGVINYAGGEPEPANWRTTAMQQFLSYAADRRDRVAVGLHEYSFRSEPFVNSNGETIGPIWYGFPYHCGRFADLLAACDENEIGRPAVLIGEWGWRDVAIPETNQAMSDIGAIANTYAEHDEVLGCAIWQLGPWEGSNKLANQVQKLILPVTNFTLQYVPPDVVDPPDPPDPPGESFNQWVWRRSIEQQTVSFNPDALLQRSLNAAGLSIVGSEFWDGYDGTTYAIQAGESIPGTKPRLVAVAKVPNEGEPWPQPIMVSNPNDNDDLLSGFRIKAPFRVPFMLTSPFNAARSYGRHEGADYDVLGLAADSLEPVLSGVNGIVVNPVPLLAGYGKHVVIETVHNGDIVRVWYAHLDREYVGVGDHVMIGQPVGEIGDTSTTAMAEHVHINLQIPGRGLSGYVVPDVIDPVPYIDTDPVVAPDVVDVGRYFMTPLTSNYWNGNKYTGDIVILKNNWGAGDERQQLQGSGRLWRVTKNRHWELRDVSPEWIDLVMDTSPGDDRAYRVTGHWLPRQMRVGESFTRTETTCWFNKTTCARLPQFDVTWTTVLKFAGLYDRFLTGRFPGLEEGDGIVIDDVGAFEWIVQGNVIERYWYGRGLGLVQWMANDGRRSYAHEFVQRGSQNDNVPELVNCPGVC